MVCRVCCESLPDKQQDERIQACVDGLGVGEEMELFWGLTFAAGHIKGKQLQRLMEVLRTADTSRGQSWDAIRWLLFARNCLAEAIYGRRRLAVRE